MSKRSRKKTSGRSPKGSNKKKGNLTKNPFLWIGVVILVGVVFLVISGRMPFTSSSKENKKGKSFSVQGGETRPVLDPSLFQGLAMRAYAAAKKYPEVLDQVFCYCTCDEPPFSHKSLFSCFVDNHGAG